MAARLCRGSCFYRWHSDRHPDRWSSTNCHCAAPRCVSDLNPNPYCSSVPFLCCFTVCTEWLDLTDTAAACDGYPLCCAAADPSPSALVRKTASAAAASLSVQQAADLRKGSRTGAPSERPPLTGGADSQPADAPGRGSTSVPATQRKQKRKPSSAKKPRKISTRGESPVSGTGSPAVHATGDGVPSQTQAGAVIQAPEPDNVTDAAQNGRREGLQNSDAAPAAVSHPPGLPPAHIQCYYCTVICCQASVLPQRFI